MLRRYEWTAAADSSESSSSALSWSRNLCLIFVALATPSGYRAGRSSMYTGPRYVSASASPG
jgi:hypothetical protein